MLRYRSFIVFLAFFAVSGLLTFGHGPFQDSAFSRLSADEPEPEDLDVPYEPSHPRVVEAMLELAKVTKDDVIYDLGCGDGRIPILAARKYGARAVCVDISAQRIEEGKEKARQLGVADKIKFIHDDIMNVNLGEATVVTVYLLNSINLKLRPKLFKELKPGTRVVSHAFHMSKWKADKTLKHNKARDQVIYFWLIPADVKGAWTWETKLPDDKPKPMRLEMNQTFQVVDGKITEPKPATGLASAAVKGPDLVLNLKYLYKGKPIKVEFRGTVNGNAITGKQKWTEKNGKKIGEFDWNAKRE